MLEVYLVRHGKTVFNFAEGALQAGQVARIGRGQHVV